MLQMEDLVAARFRVVKHIRITKYVAPTSVLVRILETHLPPPINPVLWR